MASWNIPLQINNLEKVAIKNPLTTNIIGNGKTISGLSGNPVGSTAINIGGTQSWVIASTDLQPLLQVSNSAVILGSQFSGTRCEAKTVSPSTTNDNQIATCEFVQNALSGGISGSASTTTITNTSTDATFYPTFVSATSGNLPQLVDSDFTYNPSNGNLVVGDTVKVSGDSAVGNLSFGKDAGLNSQANYACAIGYQAGQTSQGASSVAVGREAGQNTQGASSVSVGFQAGENTQGTGSVAIGRQAGQTSQGVSCVAVGQLSGNSNQGLGSVGVGVSAGQTSQGTGGVAIGISAGQTTQGINTVAIGNSAGKTSQGLGGIAIGSTAGEASQGASSVAIGISAGQTNQHANSIILNASGSALNSNGTSRFFVKPIRGVALGAGVNHLMYDPATGEIYYSTT